MSRGPRPPRGQGGAVTAELALGLPLLLAVTLAMVWLLSVGAGQVRVVDAAREAARSAARGDDDAEAAARARRVAPAGSRVIVSRSDGEVTVTVTGEVAGPGGLLGRLPSPRLQATAVALDEAAWNESALDEGGP